MQVSEARAPQWLTVAECVNDHGCHKDFWAQDNLKFIFGNLTSGHSITFHTSQSPDHNVKSRPAPRPSWQSFQYPARAAAYARANRRDAKTAGNRCPEERIDRPRICCETEAATSSHATSTSSAASRSARWPAPTQGQPQQGSSTTYQPGPPKPEALAIANFLKNQDLKPRTCIFNGQRKDMFKGKDNLSYYTMSSL